ncbi:MAG: hypothetical protein HRU20_25415 [Pseudomonadales bacterium]|nr:hypothetical protein [Pseudomonadales bacterium]
MLERVLTPQRLDDCFESSSENQYTRNLLFSTVFELMSLVVTKAFPSINSAYKSKVVDVGVSITSVYNKLNGIETEVSAALVKDTASEMRKMIAQLQGERTPLLPGYRMKMLDGNCIEASEHRLAVLRDTAAGALPGKSLVVYDPALEMAVDVFPCEDGHAQERSLLDRVLCTVESGDIFVMDRNFCVRKFLANIASRKGYFICRHHQQCPMTAQGEEKLMGETETGQVF